MIEVALVGCGRISEKHGSAIARNERVSLSAVCDLDLGRAKQTSEQFSATYYSDVDKLLEHHPQIGLISVLVPSGAHFDVAMNLIPRKIPILIEKPLTLSVETSRKLIDRAAQFETPLFVVKQNRLNPPIKALLGLVKEGQLGRILNVSASVIWSRDRAYYLADSWRLVRSLDGGVIWNQASHYVDLLVQILDPITEVIARGQNFLSPADTEDTVNAVFTSESNQMGSIFATTAARPMNFEGSITVISEKGVVRVGGHALNVLERDTTGLMDPKFMEPQVSDVSSVYGEGHFGVYDEVIDDISGKAESQFRASTSGLHVVGVMEAVEISVLEERTVSLESSLPIGGGR